MTGAEHEKYNRDELVPPSWLTEKYIRDLLVSMEKDLCHEVKPGSSAGDHYASLMFKIIASYETKNRSVTNRRLILKTMPEVDCQKKELLDDLPVFANEIRMYTETLPVMESILEKFGEKGWWPNLVYYSKDPQVLVFDDLTQHGFEMHYRPLCFEKIDIILEKCAKYHALSMVIAESEQSKSVTEYHSHFDSDKMRPLFQAITRNGMSLAATVKKWPGLEHIGEKIEKMQDLLFEKYIDCYHPRGAEGIKVLNHGDFHIRNMMFRKDANGSPSDVVFLDFQIPLYQSPGFDLVYLFNAIGDRDVRLRRDEIIRRYHSLLVENLKLYGFSGSVPSVIDIRIEVLRMSHMDAYQTLCFLPFFQLSGIELGELFSEDEKNPMAVALTKLYNEPFFSNEMKILLCSLDNLGVFD